MLERHKVAALPELLDPEAVAAWLDEHGVAYVRDHEAASGRTDEEVS